MFLFYLPIFFLILFSGPNLYTRRKMDIQMSKSIVVYDYDMACSIAKEGNWTWIIVYGGGQSWGSESLEECLKQKDWERPGVLAEIFEFRYA